MTSTRTTRRIGPAMKAAASFVADNPGCTKQQAARAVGPRGSQRYGYEIVDRAISAGLIDAAAADRGYSLTAK